MAQDDDLEGRLLDAQFAFFATIGSLIYRHAWAVSERIFKLVSWGLAVAALYAVQIKTESTDLAIAVAILFLLWSLAAFITVIQAMVSLQDALIARHVTRERARWLGVLVAILGSLGILIVFVGLILPAANRAFVAVLSAVQVQ